MITLVLLLLQLLTNNETGDGENDQSNGTRFNLVANPYPSLFHANSNVTDFISGKLQILTDTTCNKAVYGLEWFWL